jgi:hypothetical protein
MEELKQGLNFILALHYSVRFHSLQGHHASEFKAQGNKFQELAGGRISETLENVSTVSGQPK